MRDSGIEPGSYRWQRYVLPLDQSREPCYESSSSPENGPSVTSMSLQPQLSQPQSDSVIASLTSESNRASRSYQKRATPLRPIRRRSGRGICTHISHHHKVESLLIGPVRTRFKPEVGVEPTIYPVYKTGALPIVRLRRYLRLHVFDLSDNVETMSAVQTIGYDSCPFRLYVASSS